MFSWIKNFFAKAEPERVIFDSCKISRFSGKELIEEIEWDTVYDISVMTTDEGPFQEDAFIVFRSEDKDEGIIVANGADGTPALVDEIIKLPGFNESMFIDAMGCTSNNEFICWTKNNAT
jgi:hypothetical protein